MATWQDILPGSSSRGSGWQALLSGGSGSGYDWETGETPWQKRERLRREREERLDDIEGRLTGSRRSHSELVAEAEAAGIEGDGSESAGLLTSLARGLDAARGGVFAGLEELGSAVTPGGDGASLDNFRENFDQRKGVGDTELMRFADDDRWWQRTGKAVGAFVGDVATDPLTYLTFGGSVVGRKLGAEAAETAARKLAREALDEAPDAAVREVARRAGHERIARAVSEGVEDSYDDLLQQSTDDLLEAASVTGKLRGLALDGYGAGAAEAYATRGSRGLREFMGDRWFDELPAELRGGARLRVPLKRDEAGLPSAKTLPGTGGGRALDRVGLGRLAEAGNDARAYLRQSGFVRSIADRASGRYGALYGEMLSDLYGNPDDLAGIGWSKYAAARKVGRETEQWVRQLDEQVHDAALQATHLVSKKAANKAKAGEAFRRFFMDRDAARLADVDDLDPDAMAGHQAAMILHRDVIDPLGEQARALLGDDAMGWINDYVPRVLTDEARQALRQSKKRTGAGSAVKSRKEYVAEWEEVDGQLKVKRWMRPDEANEAAGQDLFETDPVKVVAQYANGMRGLLRRERLLRALEAEGLLVFTGTKAGQRMVAVDKVAQRAAEAMPAVRDAIARFRASGDRAALKEALRSVGTNLDDVGRRRLHRLEAGLYESDDGVTIAKTGPRRTPWELELYGEGEPAQFATLRDARAFADEYLEEPRAFDDLARLRDEQVAQLAEDDATLMRALDPTSLPTEPVELDAYLADLATVVGRHVGRRPDKAALTRQRAVRDDLSRWLKDNDFEEVAGDPGLRRQVATRLDELGAFAAPAIRDDLARAWRAHSGDADWQQFVDGIWRPYYTAFKTWATLGRGPGFISRNVVGGAYNAWLYDVKASHFADAGRAMNVHRRVEQAARKAVGDSASEPEVARLVAERLPSKLREALGDKGAQAYERFLELGLAQRNRNLDALETAGWFDGQPMRALGRTGQGLFPDTAKGDLTSVQRAANATVDNPWIRLMASTMEGSETFLRFASFLKGVDRWGLEDGGVAASLATKATQFDYSDLSDFERRILKNIVPFYTWSRNNVPLQLRALLTEPGKVNRLLNANEQAARLFGKDPDDPTAGHALPQWVRERHGWVSRFTYGGSPITVGIESPATDLNRWLEQPDSASPLTGFGVLNFRELVNSLNPVLKVGAETATGTSTFTGARFQPEEAPAWAHLFPGLVDRRPSGDVVDGRWANAVRQLAPPVGMFDRLTGTNDRYRERLLTSWASGVGALPVSTLTPRQERGELMARARRLRDELERRQPAVGR